MLYQSLMHIWSKDGSHIGWAGGKDFIIAVQRMLGHTIPPSTAGRWMKEEKDAFEGKNKKGGKVKTALRSKPVLSL